jgi:membrane protein DedA with SNARE-associated domain
LASLLHELHRLPSPAVYALVTLLVFGEAALFIGFVVPGETAVLVAGVVASQGRVNVAVLAGLVALSAIVGDSVGYFVGHRFGERLLTLPLVRAKRSILERALDGLRTRGPVYVFLGRFSAFLRAVMPGLAGLSKMHYRRFFIANALGGILWGVGFTLLGFYAGAALNQVASYASAIGLALVALIIAVVVALHLRRRHLDRVEQ